MKLTLQQQALGYAALYKDPTAPISYTGVDSRVLQKTLQGEKEAQALVQAFTTDPKEVLGYCREALKKIAGDEKLQPEEREKRLRRYIDHYCAMSIELDHATFPHDNQKVFSGVPAYIPDNFVDMGSDKQLSNDDRRGNREKIVIHKKPLFDEAKNVLYTIFSQPHATKQYMLQHIYYYVAQKKYSYNTMYNGLGGGSIPLDEIDNQQQMVCRHKALLFQVLAQLCGITTRLLKCDMIGVDGSRGAHVANLVRVDGQWYLIDTTNPIRRDNKTLYAISHIPEKSIDTNTQTYTRNIPVDKGKNRTYISRNIMFYQMR